VASTRSTAISVPGSAPTKLAGFASPSGVISVISPRQRLTSMVVTTISGRQYTPLSVKRPDGKATIVEVERPMASASSSEKVDRVVMAVTQCFSSECQKIFAGNIRQIGSSSPEKWLGNSIRHLPKFGFLNDIIRVSALFLVIIGDVYWESNLFLPNTAIIEREY
jgi:hypothetical protein